MTIMSLEMKDVSGIDSMALVSKFLPDLVAQVSYQHGYRSGWSAESDPEPFKYDPLTNAVEVSCPLLPKPTAALSFVTDVLYKEGITYSAESDERMTQIVNRVVLVTLPREDGSFALLFVQSSETADDVQDRVYDYEKARNKDPVKPFFQVANDITKFLIDGIF